jgi:hypothetical protein
MNHRRLFPDFAGFGPGGERARSDGRPPDFIENWIELLGDRARDECSLFADASRHDRAAILALGAIALSWRTAGDLLPTAWNSAVHALECEYAGSNIELWHAAESAIARLEQPVADRIHQCVRGFLRAAEDDRMRDRSLLELLVALEELDSLLLARAAVARRIESATESPATGSDEQLPLIAAVARWVAYHADRLDGTGEWFKSRAETLSDEAQLAANLSPQASTVADRAFAAACSWIMTAAGAGSNLEDELTADDSERQIAVLAEAFAFDALADARSVIGRIGPTLTASASMAHPGLLACRAISLRTMPALAAAATSQSIEPSAGLSWTCPDSGAVIEASAMADGDSGFITLLCFDTRGDRCRLYDGRELRWLGAVTTIEEGVARIATKDLRATGTVADCFRDAASLRVGDATWMFSSARFDETDA